MIKADFLTPYYDITFSQSAEPYKRRKKADRRYQDFRMLPDGTDEEMAFFGGKDYLPLFTKLTHGLQSKKTVFYNSMYPPQAPGCRLVRYETAKRMNWHYECANAFLTGAIKLP